VQGRYVISSVKTRARRNRRDARERLVERISGRSRESQRQRWSTFCRTSQAVRVGFSERNIRSEILNNGRNSQRGIEIEVSASRIASEKSINDNTLCTSAVQVNFLLFISDIADFIESKPAFYRPVNRSRSSEMTVLSIEVSFGNKFRALEQEITL